MDFKFVVSYSPKGARIDGIYNRHVVQIYGQPLNLLYADFAIGLHSDGRWEIIKDRSYGIRSEGQLFNTIQDFETLMEIKVE